MVVKLRLARFGRTNAPFYNIVVAHARYSSPLLPPPPPPTPQNLPQLECRETRRRTAQLTARAHKPACRTARNSKPLEVIGTYDPIPKKDSYDTSGKLHKDIRLDIDRAKYWIGVGAQPTDTVWRFLSMVRITPPDKNLLLGDMVRFAADGQGV